MSCRPLVFSQQEATRQQPRRPKKFKPTRFFGVCKHCGRMRTCVHACGLTEAIRIELNRALFDLRLSGH